VSRCAAVVVVVSATALGGCTDAITLQVESDRPIPQAIDAMCVGVADTSLSGGHFGQTYRLEDGLARLPQTLRVEAGDADAALAWVRADRGGAPVLYSSAQINFADDVTVSLPKCQVGPATAPALRGDAAGPADARIAASHGQGGTLVIAIASGASAILSAHAGQLVAADGPALPPGNPVAVVTADLDGDCDDDAIVATDGAAPVIWIRDRGQFVPAPDPIGAAAVAAIATADVDRDGDTDVVVGGGATLQLYRNDGSGKLAASPGLTAGSRATAISALALADLDGDGNPDLVVGQAGPPLVAWLGGVASFTAADAVLPAVPLDVKRLTLGDADGDFDPDLAVTVNGAPLRLYIDRDGRLEDQSFIRLPQPAPTAKAIAFGGWDAGCEPDAVIAADAGTPTLRGLPGGAFEADTDAPPASDVLMTDIDDDGDLDAILATSEGARWFAR
jgi:hypothetical protein